MKLLVGDVPADVEVRGGEVRVVLDGEAFLFRCVRDNLGGIVIEGARVWADAGRAGVAGESARVIRVATSTSGASAALTPPMPATVLRVEVCVGDRVTAGQPLLVLGAMKTELVLRAPAAGSVRALHTRVGASVLPGDRLIELDPDEQAS